VLDALGGYSSGPRLGSDWAVWLGAPSGRREFAFAGAPVSTSTSSFEFAATAHVVGNRPTSVTLPAQHRTQPERETSNAHIRASSVCRSAFFVQGGPFFSTLLDAAPEWLLARLCDLPSRVIVRCSSAGGLPPDDNVGTDRAESASQFLRFRAVLRPGRIQNRGSPRRRRAGWTEAVPWGF
jgi:hypothetical protein